MRIQTFIPIAFWALVILSSLEGNAQVPAYVPTSGLAAWYPFSGNANDSSGNGFNGTAVGGAMLTADRFGNANKAYDFNGSTSYIITTASFPTGGGAKSYSVWFKADSIKRGWILAGGVDNPGQAFGLFMQDASGAVLFHGMSTYDIIVDSIFDTTIWHHFVITFQSDTIKFYNNGILTGSYYDNLSTASSNIIFGRRENPALESGTDAYFKGKIDDIGIWNRALTPCEAYQLYHASNVSALAGTINGSSTVNIGYSVTLTDTISGGAWSSSNTAIATVGSTGIVTGVLAGTSIISYVVTNSCGTSVDTFTINVSTASCSSIITTIAGNGIGGFSGDGGIATAASMNTPEGFVFDSIGNLYVAEWGNNCIRKISPSGIISTVLSTSIYHPHIIGIDQQNNIYIPDDNHKVWKYNLTTGTLITFAGTGAFGYSGDGGPASSATFSYPLGTYVDLHGNVYISGTDNRVRRVDTFGIINTIAGNGTSGYSGDGGPATAACIGTVWGMTMDNFGNLYIADGGSYTIRKIDNSGIISTIAGTGVLGPTGDGGPATAASLSAPFNVFFDAMGNAYISCGDGVGGSGGNVRKINSFGIISTVVGNGTNGFGGDGGPATAALVSEVYTTKQDAFGNLYLSDIWNNRIRKVTSSNPISPITGPSTVNIGSTITLIDTVYGGIWSASNSHASVSGGVVTGISAGLDTVIYTVSNSCGSSVAIKIITINIATPTVPCYVPSSGLVAWYPFTGNANDSSGNGNNGTVYGATLTTDRFGNANSAYQFFGGYSSYIQTPIGSFTTSNFTICAWAKCTQNVQNSSIIASRNALDELTGIGFDTSIAYFNIAISTGSVGTLCPTGTSLNLTDSQWHFYSAIYKGDTIFLYIDNNLRAQSINTLTPPTITADFKIGLDDLIYAGVLRGFIGSIDDIGFWNQALTPCEISQLYQASCASVSAGTITGATNVNVDSIITLTDTAAGGTWSVSNTHASVSGGVVTGLSVGVDTIKYMVSNSCGTAVAAKVVTVNANVIATSTTTPVLCYAGSTGTVTVTATGGTTPYTGTGTHTGLGAGTYTYTVTDMHGITATTTATITQPTPLTIATTVTVGCSGGSTGSITTTVTGGTSAYRYLWANGSTTSYKTGLGAPTTHTLTVTDAHGCMATDVITLTPLTLSAAVTNVSCYGLSNGAITTSVTGGNPGYHYLWSGPGSYSSTLASLSGLSVAGVYSVTVTDANSCTSIASYTVTAPETSLSITEEGQTSVSCYGASNGYIFTAASGGTPGYRYLWSNGATMANVSGLAATTYTVTVTDAHGCTDMAAYTITQPAALIPTITVTPNPPAAGGVPFTVYTGYGTSILSLRANETGGTSPYTYSWATSSGSSLAPVDSVVVEVLVTKTFTITVTDHNGCTGTAVQTITVKNIESSAGHVYLCYEGTTEIVDTSAVYTELETGYYTLGPCPESGRKANTANDSANARGGLPTDAAIQVYPNPTEGTFSVEIPGIYKDAEIEVTDVTGRVMESRKVTDNTGVPEQFSLTDVAKGVYIVKVSTEGTSFVTKLIVR